MAYFVQPPQLFDGRVMSMIQWGARKGPAELRKVLQSWRLWGEKIFIPFGQLFFWLDLYTSRHSEHFTNIPALYLPVRETLEHLQEAGDPPAGFRFSFAGWQ